MKLRFLGREDLPQIPGAKLLRSMHALPTARLAEQRSWSALQLAYQARTTFLAEVVIAIAVLLLLWKLLHLPLFGWMAAASALLRTGGFIHCGEHGDFSASLQQPAASGLANPGLSWWILGATQSNRAVGRRHSCVYLVSILVAAFISDSIGLALYENAFALYLFREGSNEGLRHLFITCPAVATLGSSGRGAHREKSPVAKVYRETNMRSLALLALV